MNLGTAFWVLFFIILIFGAWLRYPSGPQVYGWDFAVFMLIGILGWHEFGPPIHG